jgi:signal transduction histidine kinase
MLTKKRVRFDAAASRDDNPAVALQTILRYANRAGTRVEFLTGVSGIILELSRCDALELRLRDGGVQYRWELAVRPESISRFTILSGTGDSSREAPAIPDLYPSVARMQFAAGEHVKGILQLKCLRRNCQSTRKLKFYSDLTEILGLAIASQTAQWALRERVKELTCLYGISRIAQNPDIALEEALQQIVTLLPPAWQFPEIACARVLLDELRFASPSFHEGPHRQTAELTIDGKPRGWVEVFYTSERAEFAQGPFLPEEESLIDSIARRVAALVERREAEARHSMLRTQLRHADRLATVGQLAAGVAHELNEPLGSILGFAQLIQKDPHLPAGSAKDVARIVKASLHAREVIHKLLVFSRQKAPVKAPVNLNRIVQDGLDFLESRCAKAGIALVSRLAPNLPAIEADPSQMHQVLVNLVVNGIQAMPDGGTLTIVTGAGRDTVRVTVEDSGIGMTEEVQQRIYTPFFTTKDPDQGTGLGLAVVHGIVTSHGGSIRLASAPGKGARFEVSLPVAGNHE